MSREYPDLDVVVIRGGIDACLEALPSSLFSGVDEERRLEPYCLYLKDRRHLDWAAGLDDDEREMKSGACIACPSILHKTCIWATPGAPRIWNGSKA